jgi:hypothetical protein
MRSICFLLAVVLVSVCASAKVTDRIALVTGKLPRPSQVLVCDAATAADVTAESALAGHPVEHSRPQTAEEIAMGRKLGGEIADELKKRFQEQGWVAQ